MRCLWSDGNNRHYLAFDFSFIWPITNTTLLITVSNSCSLSKVLHFTSNTCPADENLLYELSHTHDHHFFLKPNFHLITIWGCSVYWEQSNFFFTSISSISQCCQILFTHYGCTCTSFLTSQVASYQPPLLKHLPFNWMPSFLFFNWSNNPSSHFALSSVITSFKPHLCNFHINYPFLSLQLTRNL